MLSKVRSTKNSLRTWQSIDVENISNNLDFKFIKGFSRKFNGYIKTVDNERLISFRRTDRGGPFSTTSRIVAITSDFEFYYEHAAHEILIELNGTYFGKIVNTTTMIDGTGQIIGSINRHQNSSDYYTIQTNNEKLAFVIKNSDRRTFVKNPFYDFHPQHSFEKDVVWGRDVDYTTLMKLYREPTNNERNWVIAIVIYEAIYYGIDFTQ